MKFLKRLFRRNNKRGITLMETMIALSVIMVISTTAMILIRDFSAASSTTLNKNEVIAYVENTVECFKYAKDADEFNSLINAATGTTYSHPSEYYYYGEYKNFHITVYVLFGDLQATIHVEARDPKNRNCVTVDHFQKGV